MGRPSGMVFFLFGFFPQEIWSSCHAFSSFRKREYERDIGEKEADRKRSSKRTKRKDDSCLCLRENQLYISDGGILI